MLASNGQFLHTMHFYLPCFLDSHFETHLTSSWPSFASMNSNFYDKGIKQLRFDETGIKASLMDKLGAWYIREQTAWFIFVTRTTVSLLVYFGGKSCGIKTDLEHMTIVSAYALARI